MGNPIHPETDGVLLKGAAILGIAAIVSKLLGTLQKIPLQNIAGDEVFGVYNAVYPIYMLILTAATMGLPTAVSKIVAEKAILGQYEQAARVFKLAAIILCISGAGCFCLLYFTADWLSWVMGIPHAAQAIRSISFALLLVPLMAALRGYFQGLQNMMPTAVSQMTEQLFRVLTMVALLLIFTRLKYTTDTMAAGAAFGSVAGAFCGLAVMLFYRRRYRDYFRQKQPTQASVDSKVHVKPFIRFALPIGLASVMMPLLTAIDSFTMPKLLKSRNLDEFAILHQFGIYNHGLPFVQLIIVIVTSMAVALVPSIAEAKAKELMEVIRLRVKQALRLTLLLSLPAALGLAMAAVPLNVMFFKSAEGWQTIVILAFTAVFSALALVSASILQGFGSASAPAVYFGIAIVLKIGFNLLLIPHYGINGAAVAAVIAFMAVCFLNLDKLRRLTQIRFGGTNIVRTLWALMIMCFVLWCSIHGSQEALSNAMPHLSIRLLNTLVSLISISIAVIVYFMALLRLGVIAKGEIKWLLKSR